MNTKNLFNKIMIAAFCGVIIIGFLLGLALFLRSSYSESEKRELTKFPTFTVSTFLSGAYTEQVSTWFADTFPFREGLISLNDTVMSLKGFGSEQFQSGAANLGGEQSQGGEDVKVETIAGYYIQGDTAYEMYYQNKTNSARYSALINTAADKLKSKAKVYTVVVPLAYAYNDKVLKKTDATDPKAAIDSIYADITHKNAYKVDAYAALGAHKDEYLYFRTDHHWTARGAYYAYVAFCKAKGITPTPLESYERVQFDGFLGTFFEQAKSPAAMKADPDYVEAFIPKGTNVETVYNADGSSAGEYAVVYKGADKYSAGNKYLAFIAGDQPLIEIKTPNITDGSSIVVIKESYGNAYIPFLVDSYQTVYVIDYRKWDGHLADFVTENSIDEVLFLNVVNTTSTSARLRELQSIIE